MRDALDAHGRAVITKLARGALLVALDFDGTLAPIVPTPSAARMRPATCLLARRVAELHPTVLVTGRSVADACARLDGVPFRAVVGNHGIEPSALDETFAQRMAEVRRALEVELRDEAVDLEDKRLSLAIHLRRSKTPHVLRDHVVDVVNALGAAVRVVDGKLVVNVLPAEAPHKGHAVLALAAELQADATIYVGDDVTDEDVFALGSRQAVFGVRVGYDAGSHAEFFVRSQREIDPLLELLVLARSSP